MVSIVVAESFGAEIARAVGVAETVNPASTGGVPEPEPAVCVAPLPLPKIAHFELV